MTIKKLLLLTILSNISILAFGQTLSMQTIVSGLNEPIALENCGDERLFIIEQQGRIRIADTSGILATTPYLDITDRVLDRGNEQGLLGLAFHPKYKSNGLFYINYTNSSGASIIAQYSISNDPNIAEKNSEKILLSVDQPFANHNGGYLAFGNDGYLYIGLGDGGSAGDPRQYAQNPKSFLGKMLRIEVLEDGTYKSPSSNPFASNSDFLPEIWATGLRNPWRYSFDKHTGDLWIADVGQDKWEEVDFQSGESEGGENYGWRCKEGSYDFRANECSSDEALTDPIFEYANNNSFGCSITGGSVYRGALFFELFGSYIVTDYCSGNIWFITKEGNGFKTVLDGKYKPYNYVSFGEDAFGELYICERESGNIVKISHNSCKPKAHFNGIEETANWIEGNELKAGYHPNLTYSWYLNDVGLNESSHTITPTVVGEYKVIVSNKKGCTDTAVYKIDNLASGLSKFNPKALKIFPQPAKNQLFLEIDDNLALNYSIKIIDLSGKTVFEKRNQNSSKNIIINTTNLNSGVYTIYITNQSTYQRALISIN